MLPEKVLVELEDIKNDALLSKLSAAFPETWKELNIYLKDMLILLQEEMNTVLLSEVTFPSFCINQKVLSLLFKICTLRTNAANCEVDCNFKSLVLDLAKLIHQLTRIRLFGRNNQEKSILINLEEIDMLHSEGVSFLQIGMMIPDIDLSLITGIGDILVEILDNIVNFAHTYRINNIVAEVDERKLFLAKVSLLDTIRYRAYKHRTCCNLFNDLVSLKCSLIIPRDEDVNYCFDFLVREKACFAKSQDGAILATSSSILFHDSEVAMRFLESNVNILTEKYDGFIIGFKNFTGLTFLIENSNVVLEDLDTAHPFTKIIDHICQENRMTIYARSRLTVNFFLREFVLTRKLQYDNNYVCPTPQWCEFPPTYYALRIHKALLALCREIMICMRSFSHQEVDESVDFSAYTAVEFVLSFLLRTSFWYEEMSQLRYEVMEFILFWVDWHASNYAKDAFLAYSIPWTIKALETLISFHTCISCNVSVYTEKQIARLKQYFEIFSLKSPPEEFSKNHAIIIDHFKLLFRHISSNVIVTRQEVNQNQYFHSNRYQFNGIIGTGSQGTVLKCYDHLEAAFVAIKKVTISDENKLLSEIKLFLSLYHANIVRHLDIFKEGNSCFMVMEFCEGRSLNRFKRSWDSAEQKEFRIRIIGRQILLGLAYLHAHHVIHHDIKPENIFIDGKGVVKIGDFGIALINHKHKENNPLSGTVAYMAPECIDNENCRPSSDIWSFGCLLLFLLTGLKPWSHVEDYASTILKLKQTDEMPMMFDSLNCSSDLLDLINCMLRRNPEKRPTAVELLRSDSFSGLPETLF